MIIYCDLYDQFIASIRKEFTKQGFDHTSLDDQNCFISWQSWNRRGTTNKKRAIYRAKSFQCPIDKKAGLTKLENAVKRGDALQPWQSKLVDKVAYEDGLLNDYGILHFHLGETIDKSGYVTRTGPLLFALVKENEFYEVGIYQHGDWYELDILDIIDENWPRLLDSFTLKSIQAAYTPRNREEIKLLRKKNVTTIFTLKSGRIIFPPGGGVATDGTSIDAVHSADYWAKFLFESELKIRNFITAKVAQGVMKRKDYYVRLHATNDQVTALIDEQYNLILWKRSS